MHPGVSQLAEGGASYFWNSDVFARGAFVVFQPGQMSSIHEDIVRPEGRVHFAGEHASLLHRWVEGAVESALRSTREVARRCEEED